mmetsp:Transcript_65278/g.212614  ORF Transcript_65278/g.212614 Transcript_65278/m.212614 type:complete len:272 (+) Transcript_65278:2340-3155(+)
MRRRCTRLPITTSGQTQPCRRLRATRMAWNTTSSKSSSWQPSGEKSTAAWPKMTRILIWGGYGYSNIEEGPPGCDNGQDVCNPEPVFGASGTMACMGTPAVSPMPEEEAQKRGWVCEHRWTGVAGLVAFRRACRGLPVSAPLALVASADDEAAGAGVLGAEGRAAFRLGEECLVALVKGTNEKWPQGYGHLGDWPLRGLASGLPAGRYCDVASLSQKLAEGATSCPREVVIGSDGVVLSGSALEGDLLAIYTGALLVDPPMPSRRLRSSSR